MENNRRPNVRLIPPKVRTDKRVAISLKSQKYALFKGVLKEVNNGADSE